jgi:hypothetical protein
MEAARTSETSVDNHFTRQYNPEDSSEHHTRRRENLKSHIDLREIGLGGGVDWIRLAQDRDRWRAVVSAVMNLRVLTPRSYSSLSPSDFP